MISVNSGLGNTEKYLTKLKKNNLLNKLHRYGQDGVTALKDATPINTGKTANSWTYKINKTKSGFELSWNNSNITNGIPVVILIQYGHVTANNGFIQGRDFINPALKPVVDKILNDVWAGVRR